MAGQLARMSLSGKLALVTGASRGIGKGIAVRLGEQGCTVIVTGRTPGKSDSAVQSALEETAGEISSRGGRGIAKYCDHGNMDDVKRLFEEIEREFAGNLDLLVNNAYSGVPYLAENMNKKFYESEPDLWDKFNNVGLRNHYFCSVYGARMMAKREKGLIVNLSSFGGVFSLFNAPYGIGKAALDRMTRESAEALKDKGVAVVSLYPGAVRTEMFTNSVIGDIQGHDNIKEVFVKGESCDFVGKAVSALAADENVKKMTGRIVLTVDLAHKYGFTEENGAMPPNLRSLKHLLILGNRPNVAKWIPEFITLPGWMLSSTTNMM